MVSRRNRESTNNERQRLAYAAALHTAAQGPPQFVTSSKVYDVPLGAAPAFIAYSGTVSRLAVKFDTGGIGLGGSPFAITLNYKVYGRPTGNIRVGIRKASDDSFQLIAEWPIEFAGGHGSIKTVLVKGGNSYVMVANDKLSIEYPPNATNGLEIATSTSQGNPSGFTSQSYTGTYGNTANPLAISIVSRVVT